MRRAAAVFGSALLLMGVGVALAPPASAHPLGNFTVNRASGIVLRPGRAEVQYVLDMAEIPTFQAQPTIDTNGDGMASPTELAAYADAEAARLLSGVKMTIEGSPVDLALLAASARFRPGQAGLPTLRLEATFGGSLASASGSGEYRDRNFAGRIGWKEVTVRSEAGMEVVDSTVPASSVSRDLRAYPKDLLSSPLDVTTASFAFHPGRATATGSTASGPTVSGAPVAGGGAFAGLVRWRLTPLVLVVSLSLAFAFGALHALGPGHGKTITAAYLVGTGARIGRAAGAAAAIALMHTASVLCLGLVLFVLARSFPIDRVYPWLTLATGLLALALGAWLFVARLRSRREHHSHPHPHGGHRGHGGIWALALAGGILPSPTAFVVLTGAVAAHRLGYGLALIAAFSLGLAASLLAVGSVALRARSALSKRLNGRLALALPLASALVIAGFGLFFAARGASQLG